MNQKSTRGVQQEEVFAAADALLAERLRPTIERVRMKIGRGSPNTVAPMLEAWFATLGPRLGVVPVADGEGGAPAAVRQAADQLWVKALDLARAQASDSLSQEREALLVERQELATGQSALQAEREQLAQRESVLRDALSSARAQVEDAAGRLRQLEASLAGKDTELAQCRDSLARSVQERDADRSRFETQVKVFTDDRERHQERAAASERRLLEDVDRARQEAKAAQRELAEAGRKHQAERAELEKTNEALTGKLGEAQLEVASLHERLAAADKRASDFQGLLQSRLTRAPAAKKPPRKAAGARATGK